MEDVGFLGAGAGCVWDSRALLGSHTGYAGGSPTPVLTSSLLFVHTDALFGVDGGSWAHGWLGYKPGESGVAWSLDCWVGGWVRTLRILVGRYAQVDSGVTGGPG